MEWDEFEELFRREELARRAGGLPHETEEDRYYKRLGNELESQGIGLPIYRAGFDDISSASR